MGRSTPPEPRIFEVETPFHKKARRPGGVSKEQAIKAAQEQVETAKAGFDQWLENALPEFAALNARAERGDNGPDWFDAVGFRARELRDCATTLGFELLSFIATSLCEILAAVETGNPANMEAIQCHLNALLLAGQKSYRRLRPDQVPELTDGLHRVVKHVTN